MLPVGAISANERRTVLLVRDVTERMCAELYNLLFSIDIHRVTCMETWDIGDRVVEVAVAIG